MDGVFPPIGDVVTRKLRGVFACSNGQIGRVVPPVIEAMRDDNPCRIAWKAMIIDFLFHAGLDIDGASPIEEANVFFFFVSMLRIGFGPPASASVTA